MTSCPEARGWYFWWFLKKQLVEVWLWAGQSSWGLQDVRLLGQLVEIWLGVRPVLLGATGCAARLLGQRVEIWLWAGRVQQGVGCGRCRNSKHSKNCVSLSSYRKPKIVKLINVSYLNYGESSVFRDFSASEYFTYLYFGPILHYVVSFNFHTLYTIGSI